MIVYSAIHESMRAHVYICLGTRVDRCDARLIISGHVPQALNCFWAGLLSPFCKIWHHYLPDAAPSNIESSNLECHMSNACIPWQNLKKKKIVAVVVIIIIKSSTAANRDCGYIIFPTLCNDGHIMNTITNNCAGSIKNESSMISVE